MEEIRITLRYARNHITLYKSDLEKLMHPRVSEKEFTDRVHSWLYDIACDERANEYIDWSSPYLKADISKAFNALNKEMCSRLTKADYDAYDAAQKKNEVIARLKHWSVVTPVVNFYFEEYGMKYKMDDWHLSESSKKIRKAYFDTKRLLGEYIEENYIELSKMDEKELQADYKSFFGRTMFRLLK